VLIKQQKQNENFGITPKRPDHLATQDVQLKSFAEFLFCRTISLLQIAKSARIAQTLSAFSQNEKQNCPED